MIWVGGSLNRLHSTLWARSPPQSSRQSGQGQDCGDGQSGPGRGRRHGGAGRNLVVQLPLPPGGQRRCRRRLRPRRPPRGRAPAAPGSVSVPVVLSPPVLVVPPVAVALGHLRKPHAVLERLLPALAVGAGLPEEDVPLDGDQAHEALVADGVATLSVCVDQPVLLPLSEAAVFAF